VAVSRGSPAGTAADRAALGRRVVHTGGFREWIEKERGWRVGLPYHRERQLRRNGLEEKPRGFRVLPRRWVERRFAWLVLSRRFSKDYERLPETAENIIYGAIGHLMLRAGWCGRCEKFTPAPPNP
jgi:transposase